MDMRKQALPPADWHASLNGDPLPWLLEEETPAVRHLALRQLLKRPENDPEVVASRAAAMTSDPIATILASQHPDGYWVKSGPGYSPKYRGTVWQLIFLEQLGANGSDERIRAACAYVLAHTQAPSSGFGASGSERTPPPPSSVLHCLNGNLLRSLIAFGWLDDPRVRQAIDWQARSITGEGFDGYYRSRTSGPGFCCGVNEGLPCGWGAIKALRGLASIPRDQREPHVQRAIEQGGNFLLAYDIAAANYPAGWGNTKPSPAWFKLGFPSGYSADILQNLDVLCELGFANDPRLQPAISWLLSKQDSDGRWKNENAFSGKMWIDIERRGRPSKWVTLAACRVLSKTVQ